MLEKLLFIIPRTIWTTYQEHHPDGLRRRKVFAIWRQWLGWVWDHTRLPSPWERRPDL